MIIGSCGPDYAHSWGTCFELEFVDGLGDWSPLRRDPAEYRAHRIHCLKSYIRSMDNRTYRGSVDWTTVKQLALRLLREAEEMAA